MNMLCQVALWIGQAGQGQGQAGQGDWSTMLMFLVPFFLIFYFFFIRPQTKQQKEHQKFLQSLKRGDKVITTGGIWGKIATVTDNYIEVEVANNVKVRMSKHAIARHQAGDQPTEPK